MKTYTKEEISIFENKKIAHQRAMRKKKPDPYAFRVPQEYNEALANWMFEFRETQPVLS